MRILLAMLWAAPAFAQLTVGAKAGVLSYTSGVVYLDGTSAVAQRTQAPQWGLLQTAAGRAEILLNACAVLHLDQFSSVRMLSNRLDDTRLELVAGTAMLRADAIVRDTKVSVAVRDASVPLSSAGVYRLSAEPPRLWVRDGKVTASTGGGSVTVRAGRTAALRAGASIEKFNTDREDALDRWSMRRMRILARESGLFVQQMKERQERAESAKRLEDLARGDIAVPAGVDGAPDPTRICAGAGIR
jgi:hypothetical protein